MAFTLRRLAIRSLVCVAVIFAGLVPARAGGEFGGSGKFVGWWELGGYYGTDDSSRGEVVLFTPLMQSASTLFFLDARGKLFEEDVQEANLALGYRQMMPSGWNLGLWAGWDIRDTEENNTFHQVSFGLEALSERFDLRVNGYVPVTDPKGSPGLAEVFLRGNNILMIGGEEVPLYGVDGEVGVLLFGRNRGGGGLKGAPAPTKRHELRAYAGGFWFDADDANEEVAGPRGRLEYRINDIVSSLPGSRLTIESELSYDEVRDTKFEIGARLRIPFGARGSDAASRMAALTGQELRMIEGLERDTDIVTTQSEEENVFDTLTNVDFDRVGFVDGGGDVQGTLNDNGPNSLIILNGGTTNGSVTVGPGQTLQGGGSTINVTGRRSGTTANFKGLGAKPFLVQTLDQAVVTVNNNTHVAGLGITGAGAGSGFGFNNGFAPTGDGVFNVAITDTMIMDTGGPGIRFGNNHNNITFSNVSMANVAQAIEFDSNNSNVTITGNTISNSLGIAVFIRNNNSSVTLSGNTISNALGPAVFFLDNNSSVMVSGNTISNAGSDGIRLNGGNNITITGNTLTSIDQDAIDVGGAAANTLTITDNTFAGTIGNNVVRFDGVVDTLLDGSGNQLAPGTVVGGSLCELDGGSFTGTLEIGNQTFVNGAGCN